MTIYVCEYCKRTTHPLNFLVHTIYVYILRQAIAVLVVMEKFFIQFLHANKVAVNQNVVHIMYVFVYVLQVLC